LRLAVIGGTGVHCADLCDESREVTITTPYGPVSLYEAKVGGQPVFFLYRHGAGHKVPPHRINYRANVWALRAAGAEACIATSAVGSLTTRLRPGALVLIDSFLDFTHGRAATFYDGADGRVVHTDVTHPYCPTLQGRLLTVAGRLDLTVEPKSCYVCTNGPRYETAAEVRAFAMLGGDVVGMTGVPEVVLARELGLCYASLALVTNLGAGLSEHRLNHQEVEAMMRVGSRNVTALLRAVIAEDAQCACRHCS
jgi:5'-methylthioadenosine phosphorylase